MPLNCSLWNDNCASTKTNKQKAQKFKAATGRIFLNGEYKAYNFQAD